MLAEVGRFFRERWILRAGVFALTGILCAHVAVAADEQYLKVTLPEGQTIRQIAEKYLADPDLWTEILKASGIDSIADLHPGVELKIPANEISAANQALIESIAQIQKANVAGAQIFATEEITRAVDLHDQALVKRTERQ